MSEGENMPQLETRQQPHGQAIQNGSRHHMARRIPNHEQLEIAISRAEYTNRRSEQRRQYRQTFRNGTVYFEELNQENRRPSIERKCDKIQEDYPDISTIVPQLVEQLKHPYPGHWCGCSTQDDVVENNDDNHDTDLQPSEFKILQNNITALTQTEEDFHQPSFYEHELRIRCIPPLHPFLLTGDQRPPLYSVHQFDITSSSVSLIEWPKVLVSPEALLNGPSTSGICGLYPKGFTIEVHKYPKRNYRLLKAENTVESGRTLLEHQFLVRKFLPEGFLVRIPPNSIVLARGQTKDTPFTLFVHKPRKQCHRLRLDSNKFGQSGVQQQYCVEPHFSEQGSELFPEAFCCDIPKATGAQMELTDAFSPFHLAQCMFPDGLLIKVAIKDLLHDKSLVIVKPNDVHVPLDFGGGRDGIVSHERIEQLDILQRLSPVELAKEFFPTGLVVNIDRHVIGQLITPIFDRFRRDV